jgi:hypothetical protein
MQIDSTGPPLITAMQGPSTGLLNIRFYTFMYPDPSTSYFWASATPTSVASATLFEEASALRLAWHPQLQ